MSIRFYITLLIFLGLSIFSISNGATRNDIFTTIDQTRKKVFLRLPSHDAAALKLYHAKMSPPFRVGLFGNSRILMVGQKEMNTDNSEFFNFAVGGQSFRQSVKMLEELHKQNKLPRIAVLSFDYVELGLPGGAPVSPNMARRILDRTNDLKWLIAQNYSPKLALVTTWNYLWQELDAVKYNLSLKVFFDRMQLSTGWVIAEETVPKTFNVRDDGSVETLGLERQDISNWLPNKRTEKYPLLERDLEKLSQLRDQGTRIIIYESPLAPSVLKKTELALSDNARSVRSRLTQECKTRNFECYPPPVIPDREPFHWQDATHAPAALLGEWIYKIVSKKNIPNDFQ